VTGWSLVQRSPTECHVSKKCNREASITEAPLAPTGCRAIDKQMMVHYLIQLSFVGGFAYSST
jgi:hypothetical protein